MKYVLLIIFLGIMAATTILGYKNGFLKTLVSMLAIILSIAIVYLFSSTVTQLLDSNTKLRETVRESVYERLETKTKEKSATTSMQQQETIEKEGLLPSAILEGFKNWNNPFGVKSDYNNLLADYVAGLAVKACGIIVTLIIAFIVLKVLTIVSGIINKIPLLGMPNRVFGALLGFGRGLIIVWIVCFAITVLSSTSLGESCLEAIADSKILSLFYDGVLSFGGLTSKL